MTSVFVIAVVLSEDEGACIESGKRLKNGSTLPSHGQPQYTIARLLRTQAVLLDQQNSVYVGPVGGSRYRFGWERIGCPDGSSALCQQEKSNFAFLKLGTANSSEESLVRPSLILDCTGTNFRPLSTLLRDAHCFLVSIRGCPIRLVDGLVCRLLSKLIVDLIGRIAQSIVQDC